MRNLTTVRAIVAGAAGAAVVMLIAGAMMIFASTQSMATPAFAQKTGQPCTKCHTAPPALNDYGKKYKSSMKK